MKQRIRLVVVESVVMGALLLGTSCNRVRIQPSDACVQQFQERVCLHSSFYRDGGLAGFFAAIFAGNLVLRVWALTNPVLATRILSRHVNECFQGYQAQSAMELVASDNKEELTCV